MTVVTVFLLLCKIPSQSTQPTRDGDNDENVQISQELFVALLHYHLSGENEYEEVIEQGLEQNWMRCCGMSCMPSTRQHPPRNSGSRLGRSIWTDEACQKASAGESLYWQSTGACHAPVNAITQEGGVGPGSGEVQRNPVRRRKPPAGRKGIF